MTRTDFIEKTKNILFERFPILSEIWYSYDESIETSFISIPSKEVFENIDFAEFYAETSISYYESGLEGAISFIPDFSGLDHLIFISIRNPKFINSDLIGSLFFDAISNFETKSVEINQISISDLLFTSIINNSALNIKFEVQKNFNKADVQENNYALAA